MNGTLVGMLIECLVAILLVTTIIYCILLNRRLTKLRGDEAALRGTVTELVAATGGAERAIAELRATMEAAERSLGARLTEAERVAGEIAGQIDAGDNVLKRIVQITEAVRAMQPANAPGLERAERAVGRAPFHRSSGEAA